MNSNAKFALIWAIVFYVLNTFIGPLIGINDVEITWLYALGNLVIWGAAGFAIYYFRERQSKKQDNDEKMG
jgi:hypothetical protein